MIVDLQIETHTTSSQCAVEEAGTRHTFALCGIFTGNARRIKRNVMLRRNFSSARDDRGWQSDSGALHATPDWLKADSNPAPATRRSRRRLRRAIAWPVYSARCRAAPCSIWPESGE